MEMVRLIWTTASPSPVSLAIAPAPIRHFLAVPTLIGRSPPGAGFVRSGGLARTDDGRGGALVDPMRLADLHLDQARVTERGGEIVAGEGAGDASGVGLHVGAG